jgi:hypothetical protein
LLGIPRNQVLRKEAVIASAYRPQEKVTTVEGKMMADVLAVAGIAAVFTVLGLILKGLGRI